MLKKDCYHILYKGDKVKRKVINIALSMLFVFISFFYTNKIIKLFRNNDPIMIEIKEYENIYKDTKIDSVIYYSDIIPGIKGKKIDVNNSYSNMKKAGGFDKNLLVFEETEPNNSILNNYDNYIVSLNPNKNNISIIFELNDSKYIEEILSIINQKGVNATFFVTKDLIDNNINIIKSIIYYGNSIELLSDKYTVYEINKYNSILRLLSNEKLLFCLNKSRNNDLLNSCKSSKLYSIVPTTKKTKGLYNYLINNLDNGIIISLDNNKQIVNELSSSINYIKQKGKNIVLLKSILKQ